jgi:hypothetical protein
MNCQEECGLAEQTVPHVKRDEERLRLDNPRISLIAHVVVTIEFLLCLVNVHSYIMNAEAWRLKKLIFQYLEYILNFHFVPPFLLS